MSSETCSFLVSPRDSTCSWAFVFFFFLLEMIMHSKPPQQKHWRDQQNKSKSIEDKPDTNKTNQRARLKTQKQQTIKYLLVSYEYFPLSLSRSHSTFQLGFATSLVLGALYWLVFSSGFFFVVSFARCGPYGGS